MLETRYKIKGQNTGFCLCFGFSLYLGTAAIGGKDIPDICHFFTQTKNLDRKFYTEERVNYDKRISRQNSVNRDLLGQANIKIKITQSLSHTVCKTTHRVYSTLGLCKNKYYTKFVKLHTVCKTTH